MAIANQVMSIIMALFILGAIGATAVVLVSNATAYVGAPAAVIMVWTVAIPVIAGVGIAMLFIGRKG